MSWHPHPTEIRYLEEEGILRITFSDEVEHDYRTDLLRGYCPCARCQGHGSRPLKWNEPTHERQTIVDDIGQVGNYAICIAWADGHNEGIYSFEMLRKFAEEPESFLADYPPD